MHPAPVQFLEQSTQLAGVTGIKKPGRTLLVFEQVFKHACTVCAVAEIVNVLVLRGSKVSTEVSREMRA